MSKIEWTEQTWNPLAGCAWASPGCDHCYAARTALRLAAMAKAKGEAAPIGLSRYMGIATKNKRGNPVFNGKIELTQTLITEPYSWRKPRTVFVNSMSDLFHKDVPLEFIQKVFNTMNNTHHTYQVLTKRAERLAQLADELTWTPNIWMGVSVESQRYTERIDFLRTVPASIRFLSCEPLLGPLDMNLSGIHWVIVGGESGPKSRLMRKEWVESIHEQCEAVEVAFFFKQWGGKNKKKAGRLLHGRTYDAMPTQTQ